MWVHLGIESQPSTALLFMTLHNANQFIYVLLVVQFNFGLTHSVKGNEFSGDRPCHL